MGILDDGFGIEMNRRPRLPADVVIYQRIRCPDCKSFNCPINNTQPQTGNIIIRYHDCKDCGKHFKSIEYV